MNDLLEYKPLESIRSSYKDYNYGHVFYAMVLGYKPRLIVECGILDGYSLYHFAKASKVNSEAAYFDSQVVAFDLFDDYEYKHGNAVDVHNMLKHEGVSDQVMILQGDAYQVHEKFQECEIDMLHIDISNDGDTYLDMIKLWGPKMTKDGIIIFEGGSEERDKVEWMAKYNKKPIRSAFPIIQATGEWQVFVYKPFPSITILKRRK